MMAKFVRNATGATAIEYGLIAALLAIVVLAAITLLDDPVNGLFGGVVEHFKDIESSN